MVIASMESNNHLTAEQGVLANQGGVSRSITQVAGDKTNRDMPYFRDMWSVDDVWVIQLNADKQLNTQLFRGTVLFKSRIIFERVFQERTEIKNLSLIWYYPVRVAGGEIKDLPVIKVNLSRESAANVDWGHMPINSPQWADSYYEHPSLNNRL